MISRAFASGHITSCNKTAICRRVCLIIFILITVAIRPQAKADDTNALFNWLSAQKDIQTWSADFVQTRRLKTLTQPLTESGHVWFAAPNRFRWELGIPPKTLAVREADQMLVISPRLKRVERYRLSGDEAGPWKETLALIDVGFPRNREEIESRFNIMSQNETNGIHELTLQPKAETARRMLPLVKISFDTKTWSLAATEMQFTDGSSMRNDFKNAVVNSKLDESMFSPKIEADYKMTEPFKK